MNITRIIYYDFLELNFKLHTENKFYKTIDYIANGTKYSYYINVYGRSDNFFVKYGVFK